VEIEDTYAEAFTGNYARLLVTAVNEKWARIAATEATGYGTSMIGCSAEGGIEGFVPADRTPDGRPGYVIQIWTTKKKMKDELLGRIGQCILTCPTASVFDMCDSDDRLDIGHLMRFFGDGYESGRNVGGRECSVIPVMMGEFIIQKSFGIGKGVAGGNLIVLAKDVDTALKAGEAAAEAISEVEGVIAPFPGGLCGSGSKVGSKKYRFMHATTNEKYCPTIADLVEDSKTQGAGGIIEVVLDGTSEEVVKAAMKAGIEAAAGVEGVMKITAGNYGGELGNVLINLSDLFEKD